MFNSYKGKQKLDVVGKSLNNIQGLAKKIDKEKKRGQTCSTDSTSGT